MAKELPSELAKALEILDSDEVAKRIIKAMEEKRFFIFTHESILGPLKAGEDKIISSWRSICKILLGNRENQRPFTYYRGSCSRESKRKEA